MKTIVVGLGIQGNKRKKFAGSDFVATVDPWKDADYKTIQEVPLQSYDCALVCTPDAAKHEVLSYLISHGKHVLVEKPLTIEEQEIRRLLGEGKRRNLALYTAYNHRFEPHFVRVKRAIESGVLGEIYSLRMFYGNGTAREVRDSAWRDKGSGVLADIGSHLLDTVLFFIGREREDFTPYSFHCFENRAYDYVSFGATSSLPRIQLEATLLSWKNSFQLDILGEKGSAHVNCLCKWGPSSYSLRTRVLPSGRPPEESIVLECPDPTWEIEYAYFKELCKTGGSNFEQDIWINRTLMNLFQEAL